VVSIEVLSQKTGPRFLKGPRTPGKKTMLIANNKIQLVFKGIF